MTTGSTCDNKARHLLMAAWTNLWICLIAFFLTVLSCISFKLLIVVYSKKVKANGRRHCHVFKAPHLLQK